MSSWKGRKGLVVGCREVVMEVRLWWLKVWGREGIQLGWWIGVNAQDWREWRGVREGYYVTFAPRLARLFS